MSQVIDYQTGNAAAGFSAKGNETIDPEDSGSFRKQAHRMLDDMVDYVENNRAGQFGNRFQKKALLRCSSPATG